MSDNKGETIRCTMQQWLDNGPRWCREQIERVEITDRDPLHFDDCWFWHDADEELNARVADIVRSIADYLPRCIYARLDGFVNSRSKITSNRYFDSREEAVAAVSRAMIGWAKTQGENQ